MLCTFLLPMQRIFEDGMFTATATCIVPHAESNPTIQNSQLAATGSNVESGGSSTGGNNGFTVGGQGRKLLVDT